MKMPKKRKFAISEDVRSRAREASLKGDRIRFDPAHVIDLMDTIDRILDGTNRNMFKALENVREQLSDVYEDPTRWTRVAAPIPEPRPPEPVRRDDTDLFH